MSDTLKIDRALLERLAPADGPHAEVEGNDICGWCCVDGTWTATGWEFGHDDNCSWVAARALLDALRPTVQVAAKKLPEVFAVDPERMTLIGNNSEGVRCTATLLTAEWAQMQAWWGYGTNYRGEAEFEQLILARRILDERGEPVE